MKKNFASLLFFGIAASNAYSQIPHPTNPAQDNALGIKNIDDVVIFEVSSNNRDSLVSSYPQWSTYYAGRENEPIGTEYGASGIGQAIPSSIPDKFFPNHRWTFMVYTDGRFQIKSQHSQLCLTQDTNIGGYAGTYVAGNLYNPTFVKLESCNANNINQYWFLQKSSYKSDRFRGYVDPNYQIRSIANPKNCMRTYYGYGYFSLGFWYTTQSYMITGPCVDRHTEIENRPTHSFDPRIQDRFTIGVANRDTAAYKGFTNKAAWQLSAIADYFNQFNYKNEHDLPIFLKAIKSQKVGEVDSREMTSGKMYARKPFFSAFSGKTVEWQTNGTASDMETSLWFNKSFSTGRKVGSSSTTTVSIQSATSQFALFPSFQATVSKAFANDSSFDWSESTGTNNIQKVSIKPTETLWFAVKMFQNTGSFISVITTDASETWTTSPLVVAEEAADPRSAAIPCSTFGYEKIAACRATKPAEAVRESLQNPNVARQR